MSQIFPQKPSDSAEEITTAGGAVDVSQAAAPTAGQVLTATDATHATWQAPAAGSPLTTKGDVFTYSTLAARLPVGTNGQVLKADSTTATGLAWGNLFACMFITNWLETSVISDLSTTPASAAIAAGGVLGGP